MTTAKEASMHPTAVDPRLQALRTSEGNFAMVALDQRESLREMFPRTGEDALAPDAALQGFKSAAVASLSPLASGMLLDHPLGIPGSVRPPGLDTGCGLLLAADRLHSVRGAGVESTELDAAIDSDLIRSVGADALKYLVIWRRNDDSFRPGLEAFLRLAEGVGLPTFVEGIVRPPRGESWRSHTDRFEAIREAAADLSPGASVYKAEVPGYTTGDLAAVEDESRALTAVLDIPWVVLSNGVARDDFADAVSAACAGGAHGFLAGRAIWADTVADPDPAASIAERSVPRLEELKRIVSHRRREAVQGGVR